MFTGLVEDTGVVVAKTPHGNGVRLVIRTALPLAEVRVGDSIACDGCCLTAERLEGDRFSVTAGRETLDKTTVGTWSPGRRVHLERALRVGDRLGGHLVQGHVDGVGRVVSAAAAQESVVAWIEAPAELARLVATKGSITVDGVSLTVNEVAGRNFRINLIPHTVAVTHLGELAAGRSVNLEVDVIARYVERLLAPSPDDALDQALTRAGFRS